jgi:twinkle protein
LDHISIVVSGLDDSEGDGERRMIDVLMTKLRSLINETGIGMFAICHLKRPPGQGKSFNEGRPVSLTDLRGSAALEQLSDAVIAIEGNQQGQSPNSRIIRVLKNRPIGLVGVADTLYYDHNTGRLKEDNSGQQQQKREEFINDDF